MFLRRLIRFARKAWQKRLVRLLVAGILLAGAIGFEYRLSKIPSPIRLDSNKDSPQAMAYAATSDELIVTGVTLPSDHNTDRPPNALIIRIVERLVSVDVDCESAEYLPPPGVIQDEESGPPPPMGRHRIDYVTDLANPPITSAGAKKDQCQTQVTIGLAEPGHVPAELYFYRVTGQQVSDIRRSFWLRPGGADLKLSLATPSISGGAGLGCHKYLHVDDWSHSLNGPVTVDIFVPRNTSCQFSFTSIGEETAFHTDFEPLPLEENQLSVSAISVRAHDAALTAPPAYRAEIEKGSPPLKLMHLFVDKDSLRLEAAGDAIVQSNGKYENTFNLPEIAKRNITLAGLLVALDGLLLAWLGRISFGSIEPKPDPADGEKQVVIKRGRRRKK